MITIFSQKEKIIEQLKINNYVSRNWCLKNYISRLGAIIWQLKKEGWDFNANFFKYNGGKDFRYYVIKMPSYQRDIINNQQQLI